MKLIEHNVGSDPIPPYGNRYWVSDDPARITFGTSHLSQPEVVNAVMAGHCTLVRPPTCHIRLENLAFLAAAQFGGETDVRKGDFHGTDVQSCVRYALYAHERTRGCAARDLVMVRIAAWAFSSSWSPATASSRRSPPSSDPRPSAA